VKFGHIKLEISAYCVVYNIFQYIEPFKRGSPVSQTDSQNYDSNSVGLTMQAKNHVKWTTICYRINVVTSEEVVYWMTL